MKDLMCRGFKAAGIACGLKKTKARDLGLIVSEVPANAAGVFTKNRVQAAPVLLDKERIQSGFCQAIIVNSGNANCCTGQQGIEDARTMARAAAEALGIAEDLVLTASTGVIGAPLPVEKIQAAAPKLVQNLSADGIHDVAQAIMTTDTVPKIVFRRGSSDGREFTVVALAKGAGMIRPDMATMLCFVCTDVLASSQFLQKSLIEACDRSFNRITIDGDTSTNDTVLLLANGMSEAGMQTPAHEAVFQEILDEVLLTLARMIVKDGEGATKLVEIMVRGAADDADARRVADAVAHSNLVKTALFGEDANWGRILAAAGRSGACMIPEKTDLYFNSVQMVKQGFGCGKEAEDRATAVLKTPEFAIVLDLNIGRGSASMLTCDFSIDYVKINADYRS